MEAKQMPQAAASKKVDPNYMPEEAKGLCWGGFFFTVIWGAFNRSWITLLTLIPPITLAMPFIILFKGREWAWKNNQWDSVEHFKRVQKNWSVAGLILFFIQMAGFGLMLLMFGAAILGGASKGYQMKAKMTEAKLQLSNAYAAKMTAYADKGDYTGPLNEFGYYDSSFERYYKVGFAEDGPEFAQVCPDCSATKDGFKIVAFGNLDGDPDLDVWTIDQDKNMVHVKSDM